MMGGMSDDPGWLYEIEPVPWPLPPPVTCPGCTVKVYGGVWDASCHYSFCTIMNPPLPPFVVGLVNL